MNVAGSPTLASPLVERSYRYQALRSDGNIERGEILACDESSAIASLSTRGLFPLEVSVRRESWSSSIGAADLAIGLRILATLVDAGLPLRRAASSFGALAPKSWAPITAALVPALREGRTITAALSSSSVRFPEVALGIIRAGEASGALGNSLRAAAEFAESTAATRSAIRAALAYPAILALGGLASTTVLVAIVLPRFAVILTDLGQQLPPTTKLVLATASLVQRAAVPVALVLAALVAGFRLWIASENARRVWAGALLELPLIGTLRHSAATSRSCAALGALLDVGVAMPPALAHAAKAAGDAAVSERMMKARESVIAGRALGQALEATEALTPAALKLIRAGEESGRLPSMLAHAARLERERSIEGVRRLVRLIEPSLVVLFAGIVALIAAALLQAVYSVRPV